MTSGASTRYGAQAQAHWMRWRPWGLAQIPDQAAFFAELEEQVERQADLLASDLAGRTCQGRATWPKWGGCGWPGSTRRRRSCGTWCCCP